MAKTEILKSILAITEDFDAAGLSQSDNKEDRKSLRHNVFYSIVCQKEKRKKSETVWSDEMKRGHSEDKEQVWIQIKENLSI